MYQSPRIHVKLILPILMQWYIIVHYFSTSILLFDFKKQGRFDSQKKLSISKISVKHSKCSEMLPESKKEKQNKKIKKRKKTQKCRTQYLS